jgi:O-antigen/teichoic acid export membrane protein
VLPLGLVSIVLLIFRHQDYLVSKKRIIPHLLENFSIGKWLILTNLALMAGVQLYPWIIVSFHGPAATAQFAACLNVLYIVNPLLIGMSNFIGPKTAQAFASGNVGDVGRLVYKGTVAISMVMGCFSLTMFLFGGSIIEIIYGEKYAGNGLVVSILALSQLSLSLTFPINQGLISMGKADVGFKGYLFSLSVTLLFGIWAVNNYGLLGAATSLFFGNLAASAYRFYSFRKCLNDFM